MSPPELEHPVPEYNPEPLLAASPEAGALLLDAGRWEPILNSLGPDLASAFVWKATTDTIETYEHRVTLHYVHIDGITGEFFDQQCNVISKESALAHALPKAAPVLVPSDSPAVTMSDAHVVAPSVAPVGTQPAAFEPVAASLAENATEEEDDVTEPALAVYMRKHNSGPETQPDAANIAIPAILRYPRHLMDHVQAAKRRGLLAWSELRAHDKQETYTISSISEPQERSLSAFTRRTSILL